MSATAAADLDAARGARLLFDAELAAASIDAGAVETPTVLDAIRPRPVPSALGRLAQDVRRKLGRYDHERAVDGPLVAARQAVLGEQAAAPPRFLVRVDEFPHYEAWDDPERFGSDGFARFHEILAVGRRSVPRRHTAAREQSAARSRRHRVAPADGRGGGAAAPRGGLGRRRDRAARARPPHALRRPAPPLRAVRARRGRHRRAARRRARRARPPRRRTPTSSSPPTTASTPPNSRCSPPRFPIVCGGPESIRRIGFQRTPQWRDGAVYLPAYAPFYGHAREVLPAAERAIAAQTGLWTPIVLHWGWEADAGWRELEALCERIAPYAAEWTDFRAAVERSR